MDPLSVTPDDYRPEIAGVARDDVAVVAVKDAEYDGSWMRRGGRGAYENLCRKWDRIQRQVSKADGDVFAAILADQRAEGIMDDVADLRRYLLLVEAWARAGRRIRSVDGQAHPFGYEPD